MSLFFLRLPRLLASLPFGLALAAACSVPDYRFEDEPPGSTGPLHHCENQRRDEGESAIDCGGGECPACVIGQTCVRHVDCVGGQCVEGFCQDPSCADERKGPGETDVDCGGPSCRGCGAGRTCDVNSDCASTICESTICTEPSCEDGVRNGTEVDVDCGGGCSGCKVGAPCGLGIDCASGLCENGRCGVSCIEGKGECDGDLATDCETNIKTSALHCGACGSPCNVPHADPGCVGGTCTIVKCRAPYDDCNSDPSDGCETNLNSDIENCQSCGMTCSSLNGTPSCSETGCQIACDAGYRDCNDDRGDGCEKSTSNDVANCGGCNIACVAQGAGETPYCKDGSCGSTQCAAGVGNCNGYPEDACETNLLNDAANCGACGNVCIAANGIATCQNGKCEIKSCNPGFGNCDATLPDAGYATGCETNTNTSLSHCGGCGMPCSIANGSPSCEAGSCKVKSCTAPYQDCDADGLDCETNIETDKANCGGCGSNGVACDTVFANATGKCEASACKPDKCSANFGDCDGNAANGCESDLRIDSNDCGECGKQCKTLNASSTRCSASTCQPTCNGGYAACSDPAPGCSDSLDLPAHCGTCTNVCSASAGFCISRACRSKLDLVLVNSNTQGAMDGTLSLSHTLATAAGQYRLVLLAVTSLAPSASAARPETVTYAGRAMRAYGSPATYGTPSAFVSYYYLVDSELPRNPGAVTVLIDSTAGAESARLEANVIEFKGVEQATPFDSVIQATGGGCGSVSSLSIAVVTAGSYVYSLAGYEWGSPATPLGMLTQTFDQNLNFGNLRGVGGYRGPLAAGSYAVGWNTQSCNNSAHRVIAIRPATTP